MGKGQGRNEPEAGGKAEREISRGRTAGGNGERRWARREARAKGEPEAGGKAKGEIGRGRTARGKGERRWARSERQGQGQGRE